MESEALVLSAGHRERKAQLELIRQSQATPPPPQPHTNHSHLPGDRSLDAVACGLVQDTVREKVRAEAEMVIWER